MKNKDIKLNDMEASREKRMLDLLKDALGVAERTKKKQPLMISEKSLMDYEKVAANVFGTYPDTSILIPPVDASLVIQKVSSCNKVSTLRKQVQSILPICKRMLFEKYEEAINEFKKGKADIGEMIVMHPSFKTLITLSEMRAAEYRKVETPKVKRESKKSSLTKLPHDWREILADTLPVGHFTCPALALLLSGARPAEIERGIEFVQIGHRLRARIWGAKITENGGQPWRSFDVADGFIKDILLDYVDPERQEQSFCIKVKNGNSLTTHIRDLCRKIWPDHKQDVTCYTARHAMAADCKRAIINGADPDLTSKVLGHRVDKTASFYGSSFQGGGVSLAPTNVKVSRPVRNKQKLKNGARALPCKATKHAHAIK